MAQEALTVASSVSVAILSLFMVSSYFCSSTK